jgi:hypothetical protein
MTVHPDGARCQYSYVYPLPSDHQCIQLIPTYHPDLMHRDNSMFLHVNGQPWVEKHRVNAIDLPKGPDGMQRPIYDIQLKSGETNSIEMQILAGPRYGAADVHSAYDLELVRLFVFPMPS